MKPSWRIFMKACKACGLENRDEAKFCRGCGSPLPQKKAAPVDPKKEKAAKKFWTVLMISLAVTAVIGMVVRGKLSEINKKKVINQYTTKYEIQDDMALGTVTDKVFFLQSLGWNMTQSDIKRVFPYAVDSTDPDFTASMTVAQVEFKVPLPHADFMSLGLYNGRLYAVKYEFGALEKFESQQLKVPDKDEIMYGRFRGLYKTFTKLYGKPAYEKNDVKSYGVIEGIKLVKAGKMPTGKPSNIYIYWNVGYTKVELVFFGNGRKVHLTARFLYTPVWDVVGK
jgi:hypothetical protein